MTEEDDIKRYMDHLKQDDAKLVVPDFNDVIDGSGKKGWYWFAASVVTIMILAYAFYTNPQDQKIADKLVLTATPMAWDEGSTISEWTSPTTSLLKKF